jgi:hypothetical protein
LRRVERRKIARSEVDNRRLEAIELFVPEVALNAEPGLKGLEAVRIDRVDAPLRVDSASDESGVAKHLQVMRDGGSGASEVCRDLAREELITSQQLDYALACLISEGGKHFDPSVCQHTFN